MSEPVDGIMARLELVGVEARRRSAEIESQRSLPRDLVDALVDTGVFRLTVPSALGGADAELSAVLQAVRGLAAHDGSTGWVVMSALLAGLDAARLPRHHATTVLAEPRAVVAGHRGRGGTARRTDDGGLVVTGRWSWGAGVATSSWIAAGVSVPAESVSNLEPEPEPGDLDLSAPVLSAKPSPVVSELGADLDLVCLFRRDQVVVLDTWHAMGLQGAGATDFQVTEAFVPEGRWIGPLSWPSDGTRLDQRTGQPEAARDRYDLGDLVAVGAAAVALGLADRAIEEAGPLASADARPRAAADLAAAGAFLATAVGGDEAASGPDLRTAGSLPDQAMRPDGVAAALHAVEVSVSVVEQVYRLGGPAAVLHASVLQRLLRDVQTLAQFPAVSPSRWSELGGRWPGSAN